MSFTATVENDTIKLPPGMHLPDGTEVIVQPTDNPSPASFFESVRDLVGKAQGLPADFAAEHDHY